jgi:hypothetical protein
MLHQANAQEACSPHLEISNRLYSLIYNPTDRLKRHSQNLEMTLYQGKLMY